MSGGKVVVNRSMSLDGFVAGPPHLPHHWPRMTRVVAPEDLREIAGRTGAMLVGRRTWDVGDNLEQQEPGSVDYPFSGPMFLLSHRPLDPPDPDVTVLSGDIGSAVATALAAADGKDLEVLGSDVASQCFAAGLVDEVLVYVLPMLAGEGVRFSDGAFGRVQLEPLSSKRSRDVTILRFRVRR